MKIDRHIYIYHFAVLWRRIGEKMKNGDKEMNRKDTAPDAVTSGALDGTPAALLPEKKKKSFNGYYLIAAFLIPFAIMLGVYACLGKHPFGNNSVLTLDLQAQYVYYYEAIRRLLVEGGSWLYSWERTLGGEFMGIVAYYMASPFNLILVLFPKSMLADAVMFIQLAKVGAMGLTFAYYLRKTRKTSDMQTIVFSMMYALCSYAIVNLVNPMWLDAMVFLPLLVLGIESMIRQRKFILYTVSLIAVFVTNYYMGYMCAIFTFIYYLYYYFLVRDELAQNQKAQTGGRLSRALHSRGFETFMRFAVFTVIALLASAFMLLCAWYSLQFGKTEFATTNYTPSLRFDFLDIFVKMLPGSYDTVRPNGLPMIYCGMLALLVLPLFFMSPTISRKKKLLSAGVLAVLLVSFSVNTIDLVWHGFSGPNWLNYRYSYLFSFFVLLMACDALRGIRKIRFGKVLAVGVFVAVLVLIVQKLNYVFDQDTKTNPLDDAQCILLSLVLIAAYMIVLRFLKSDGMASAGSFALAIVVCVEMFAVSLITVTDEQMDVGSVRYANYLSSSGSTEYYDSYTGSIKRIESVVNEVLEKDQSFYRMESTVYRRLGGVNEPMAHGFNGVSHSTSTLNKSVITLMDKLGYASMSHWTKYLGGTPISDALLGIKYVITRNDRLDENFYTVAASGPEYYEYIPSSATIYAMQNTKALSVAYGVSPDLLAETEGFLYPPYYSGLDLQNRLINAMLSGVIDTPNVLRGIYAPLDTVDCTHHALAHSHSYTDENGETQYVDQNYYFIDGENGGGTVRFVFEAEADGDIYAHFPGVLFSGMSTECGLYVNGRKVSDYFTNETWVIQNLGTFEEGDEVEVELRFENGDLYISHASSYYFYYIDYAALNAAFSELEAASMYVEEHGNDFLRGTIDIPEGQELVFTTIPYDEGWKVYIDGEQVELIKTLGSLLAVETTPGFHEIEFVYRPDCAVYGGMLSIIGIALFALFVLWSRSAKVRRIFRRKDERDTHFFYYGGDSTTGWLLEDAEMRAAMAGDAADGPLSESADVDVPQEAESEASLGGDASSVREPSEPEDEAVPTDDAQHVGESGENEDFSAPENSEDDTPPAGDKR